MKQFRISVAVNGRFVFRTDWTSFDDTNQAGQAAEVIKKVYKVVDSTAKVSVTLHSRDASFKSEEV